MMLEHWLGSFLIVAGAAGIVRPRAGFAVLLITGVLLVLI